MNQHCLKLMVRLIGRFLGIVIVSVVVNAQTVTLSVDSSEHTAVTIYSTTAIVRHQWTTQLTSGKSTLRIQHLPDMIAPLSLNVSTESQLVQTRTMQLESPLATTLELLQKCVGRNITLRRRDGIIEGELVMPPTSFVSGSEPCYVGAAVRTRIGELLISPCGELVLHPPTPTISLAPVLSVELSAQSTISAPIELRYQCDGLQWAATYDAILLGDDKLQLEGFAHILNNTHSSFRCDELRLIAGSVNLRTARSKRLSYDSHTMQRTSQEASTFAPLEESFDEYHLYTLPFGATLPSNATATLQLRSRVVLPIKRQFVAYGRSGRNVRDDGSVDVPVSSVLEFTNTPRDSQALPAGTFRVWRRSASRSLELVGQDEIPHTAVGERVRVELGTAFDLRVRRRELDTRRLSERVTEYTVEFTLHNTRAQPMEISVIESFAGNWEILSSTIPFVKRSSQNVEFTPTVPAKGTLSFRYIVRQSW
jgi:hypothetical protein